MSKVYTLSWDKSHLVDVDKDAWLVKFPGWENVVLSLTQQYELPNPVEFKALFDVIENSDFPITEGHWPVMSTRMLRALESVKEFSYRIYPVKMIDCEIVDVKNGEDVFSGKTSEDFNAVQILERLDVFDWESSIYEPHPRKKDKVRRITKLVLKEPGSGFPPVFRIPTKSSILLISENAKEALQEQDIQGISIEAI